MDTKTELVLEYFHKKYGFDIQKLGIDKKSKNWLDKTFQALKTKFSKN